MLPVPGLDGAACEQLEDPFLARPGAAGEESLAEYLHVSTLAINQLTVRLLGTVLPAEDLFIDQSLCGP